MIELIDVTKFALSIVFKNLPNIISKIKGNKDLEGRIEQCFYLALNKWDISEETKNNFHYDKLKHYNELQSFLAHPEHGIHPKTKELLRLWVNEMYNDEICSNFIIIHKEELTNCKLDSVYEALKDDLCPKVDKLLEGQEELKEILKQMVRPSSGDNNLKQNIMSLLNGAIASMIEEMKMDSALRLLNELEVQFKSEIDESSELKAQLYFKKGLSLYYRNTNEAQKFLYKAYTINPQAPEFIKWEIKRLLSLKDYKAASLLSEKLTIDLSWKHLIAIILSDNEEGVYKDTPNEYRDRYDFRLNVFDALLIKDNCDLNFLFESEDITIPYNLSFSNLNDWLFIITFYRYKLGNFLPLTFDITLTNRFETPKNIISIFAENLSKTELRDSFSIIKKLYCYWNFIYDHNTKWVDDFLSISKKNLGEQRTYFQLIETSMLLLAGRFEEAFASLVSISDEIDNNILRFAIMMSIQTHNVLHLRWALEKVSNSNMNCNKENEYG